MGLERVLFSIGDPYESSDAAARLIGAALLSMEAPMAVSGGHARAAETAAGLMNAVMSLFSDPACQP